MTALVPPTWAARAAIFGMLVLSSRCHSAPVPSGREPPRPAARAEMVHTLTSPSPGITHVAFSPDGKLLATSSNKTVTLWDASSGKDVRTFRGHSQDVYSCAFRPDGKRLATASRDHSVKLWDVATGKELRTCIGHGSEVYHVAFSPDGKTVASASQDQTVRLWDAATGALRRTLSGHTARVVTLAFSPDGRRLVSTSPSAQSPGSDDGHGDVKVWDVEDGRQVLSLSSHTPGVVTIVFSPDGRRLAGSCLDHTVKLWELASGRETLSLAGHSLDVYSVAFSPDGRRLASCSGEWNTNKAGEVKLWELPEGRELLSFRPHILPMWAVAFRPDSRLLATASGKWLHYSEDAKSKTIHGEVKLWRLLDLPAARTPAPLSKAQLQALWADLAGTDAVGAYRAVWALSATPEPTVPFLLERVRPAVSRATPEQIARLIRDLDDSEFAVREKAEATLDQLGRVAQPALRKALRSPSLEVRRRAARLLEKKDDGQPSLSPDEARGLRVVEVLLRVGTVEGHPVLRKLADGDPGSPVTQEAAAALALLSRTVGKPLGESRPSTRTPP